MTRQIKRQEGLEKMMENLDKNLPSDNPDNDVEDVVLTVKKVLIENKRVTPMLFIISKTDGVNVAGGEIPQEAEGKRRLFTELGNAIADKTDDVEMFILATEVIMNSNGINEVFDEKTGKKKIEKNQELKNHDAIVVSVKKINGDEKTLIYPFTITGGSVEWRKIDYIENGVNTFGWVKENEKDTSNFTKNNLLEDVFNGYVFHKFLKELNKKNGS